MRAEIVDRLDFVKAQIRGVERAFMGGGFVHAAHEELDKMQIFFSSHPAVLTAVKDVRTTMADFLTTKINGRLDGEDRDHYPVAVWHSYNQMELAIRATSTVQADVRRTAAA